MVSSSNDLLIKITLVIVLFLYFQYLRLKITRYNEKFEVASNIDSQFTQNFLQLVPKVIYINLEKRQDRNTEFLSNFPNYEPGNHDNSGNIERIEAVFERINGNIGCLKSHIIALTRALEIDTPYILICEDDFYIKDQKYTIDTIKMFFDNIKTWDVLMFGINLIQSEDTAFPGIIKVISAQTTSGYLIKKSYIPKLLDIYKSDLDKYTTSNKWSDFYCTDQSWKQLQSKDLWYSFKPPIGVQRQSFSDILNGMVNYGL